MAGLTIDIGGAAQAARIADAFADVYGYQAQVPDPQNPAQMIPNPVSKGAFVKQQIIAFVKQTVAGSEGNKAGDQARNAAIAQANSDLAVS